MATSLTNQIVPAIFAPYVLEQSVVKNALLNSGIIANNPVMSNYLATAGDGASLLSFKGLDAANTAANVSSTDPAVSATPEQVIGRRQNFRRIARNKGFVTSDLEAALLGVDPANAVAAYVANCMNQWRQTSLRNTLVGCVNETNAANLVNTIAVEAVANYGTATRINAGTIGDTLGAWGDFGTRDMGVIQTAIFMHSATYRYLTSTDYTSFQRASDQTFGFTTYLGMPVYVDDTLPRVAGSTDGFKYTTYLVKPGAINFGFALPKNPTEIERIAAAGNGGGVEQLWQRDEFAFHINGFSFTGSIAGDNVTDTELATANKWTKVLEDKLCGVLALVHNLAA